ncbi:hypothetical protein FKM82_029424 [Ascaphus truei]
MQRERSHGSGSLVVSEEELHRQRSRGSGSLVVSEEELQRELSLLGFSSLPRQRLLEFKQDLERLMSHGGRGVSPGPSGDKEVCVSPLPRGSSAWDQLSAWATPSSSSSQEWGEVLASHDPYSKHTVSVGGHGLGTRRAPLLTRKVLRRKSDGQTHVSDESTLCSETDTEDTACSEAEPRQEPWGHRSPDCLKSFIRPPPDSLLQRYRQRSDPVCRYQEYKQSWDTLQGALERSRKEVRWGVREQMMARPPQPLPRTLHPPNPYVVPTDKKRYGLRWGVRRDLVNGIIPRGNCP